MRNKSAVIAAVCGLVALGSTVELVRVHWKLHSLERNADKTCVSAESAAHAPTNGVPAAIASFKGFSGAKEKPVIRVEGVEYDGKTHLRVALSARPDMSGIRNYVSVSPMNSGFVGISYCARYSTRAGDFVPTLVVTGDFAFRTNLTLRIRKGLAPYGKGDNPAPEGALAADYTYAFQRKDLEEAVGFAANGRYLPPCGARTIGIESVNAKSVQAVVRRVEPRNIVQLLAREERAYKRYYGGGGDSEDTVELSGAPTRHRAECANRMNRKEISWLPVAAADGGPSNGVFLVTVGSGERPFDDREWISYWNEQRNEKYNPPRFRLVCVSDLGVSVRKSASGCGVWVTSFTTGRPVSNAVVEVCSKANVRVLAGRTDASGWCAPKRVAEGEPFAVVVSDAEGTDRTFLALSSALREDETYRDGARGEYLKADELTGFVWTERGIYRHGERIFCQLLLRNGEMKAPAPFPVTLRLLTPDGKEFATKTVLSDACGALQYEGFAVPDEQPSGLWTIEARLPGKDGNVLAAREVKIEEFAPPQIRVRVAAAEGVHPTNFAFTVSAEHLFGGPAGDLACEGAVVFEDVPFAPAAWKGYRFGNPDRGLRPSYRELADARLGADGCVRFAAPLWADTGRPKAAVRATGQGRVLEDGGRAATARATAVLHYYPYYIGSTMGAWVKPRVDGISLPIACVSPDGRRLAASRRLTVRLERIDSVYAVRESENGGNTWDCERIRSAVLEDRKIVTATNADTVVTLPVRESADYAVTVTDEETGVSYGNVFYLSDCGDAAVRAPLANPTEVTIACDKAAYRVGEKPRLVVKSPFAGFAMMSVQRETERYTEILELTNATSIVELRPVAFADAPNLDVYVSVVQSVKASARHLAARARGQATVRVMPEACEIPVEVRAECRGAETARIEAAIAAPGAEAVWVTVVDEGINLLTGEPTPDPVGAFAQVRGADHPLYDLYSKVLPVDGEALRKNGVKTGGGFGAEMLGRVSPAGTRRFKPLAMWSQATRGADGRWRAAVDLPPFAGEVRVTAVAHSATATGAASVRQKVAPKLVIQPDAPRFAAPGDVFEAILPIRNRSGAAGDVTAKINGRTFSFRLEKDASTNLTARLTAPDAVGDFTLAYSAEGFGERHAQTILLPVRPAVAWVETSGIGKAGLGRVGVRSASERYTERVFDSPVGEYAAALNWLAEYRHGCLEQTCSRVFPLVWADGLPEGVVTNRAEAVARGVARVVSMIRKTDFVMWPDCDYPPWNREVSLYAAHFLVAADRAGAHVQPQALAWVKERLGRWIYDRNPDISTYAAYVRTLAGSAERDRLYWLYDGRGRLPALARSRLALAFAHLGDFKRAQALLEDSYEPQSVREAAFQLMARTAIDPKDERLLPLVAWLNAKRGRERLSWGTTEENAHALLAIGAYYRANPPKPGEKYVAWRKLTLPKLEDVRDEAHGLFIARRLRRPDGSDAPLDDLRRGQLLYAELTITSDVTRVVGDLVVEDLFAGAFDPVHSKGPMPAFDQPTNLLFTTGWLMRSDMRDDRMLVFSKSFTLETGHAVQFTYPLRVVSSGAFVLPGPSVEAMYNPELRATCAPKRIRIK